MRINTVGREALDRFAERIDMKALEAYPAYLEFRDRTRDTSTKKPGRAPGLAPELAETPATPQELVEQAVATNRAAVEGDVLRSALALTPTGFEELVLRLLTAMGYGELGSIEQTSASGDAGVDGIISQDPLGLDRIYICLLYTSRCV